MAVDTAAAQEPDRAQRWTLRWAPAAAKPLLVPTLLFTLALTLRLAWVLTADVSMVYQPVYDAAPVDYAVPPGIDDVTYYLHTARSIAQGEGYAEPFFGTPSARFPPGWAAVLSVFYRLFGTNTLPAVIFNAVVGAFTCVLTYVLGSRLFGPKIGLGAGSMMALFPVHILFSPMLLTEVFFTFLLTLTLLFAVTGMGGWRALVLGLLTGAATLVRGEAVLLPIVFLIVLFLRGATGRTTARQIALVGVGMALLLVPWAVRNSLQLDTPVLLTTSAGVNLMIGHASGVQGGGEFDRFFELAEPYRDVPEPQRQIDIQRAAFREAWDEVRSDPLGDLALIPAKLRWFYRHDPTSGQVRLLVAAFWHGPLPFRSAQVIAQTYYYFVLAGAVLLVALRYPATWQGAYGVLFGVIGLWSFIFGFLFFGDDRYHIPLLPLFSIAATAGFAMLLNRADSLRRTLVPTSAKAADR